MYVKEHAHLVCLDVCLFVFLSYLYIDLDLTSIFPLVYQSKIFALIIICLSHTNTHTQRHEGSVNVEDLFIYSPLPLSRSGHLRQLNAHKALLWKHQPASPSLGIWGLTAKQRTRAHTQLQVVVVVLSVTPAKAKLWFPPNSFLVGVEALLLLMTVCLLLPLDVFIATCRLSADSLSDPLQDASSTHSDTNTHTQN